MPEFVTYPSDHPFPGRIGRTLETSSEAWPAKPTAPEGAPNVVIIVLDDVGYGQLSPFGGLCETPNLDRLASRGLRYANFQTTALCSPTRGSLLTGRNHHRLGLSAITEMSMGFPAHNATIGHEHGFLSEMLVERGCNTFAVGKWHLTAAGGDDPGRPLHPLAARARLRALLRLPRRRHRPVASRPHPRQPLGAPASDARGWLPPQRRPGRPGDRLHQRRARERAPTSRSSSTTATGAGHAPHQVEQDWIDRYAGAFDMGWDEYRRIVFERQLDAGPAAPGHRALRARPRRTSRGTRSPTTPSACTRARWRSTRGS